MASVTRNLSAVDRITEARRLIDMHLQTIDGTSSADLIEDVSERVYEAILDYRFEQSRRERERAEAVRTVKTPVLPGGGGEDDEGRS